MNEIIWAWILMGLAVGIPLTMAVVAWVLPTPRCRCCHRRIDALWLPDGICSGCRAAMQARQTFAAGLHAGDGYDDD